MLLLLFLAVKQVKEDMYKLTVRTGFSGAHFLKGYKGQCARLHGHNWTIKVTAKTTELNELGMGIDFKELKRIINIVIDQFDHSVVNEHPAFKDRNPTAEHLANYFCREINKSLPGTASVESVEVWESENYSVKYVPSDS